MGTSCFESNGYLKFLLVFILPFTVIFHFSALYAAEWHEEKITIEVNGEYKGTEFYTYGLFRECRGTKCQTLNDISASVRFIQIAMIFSVILLFMSLLLNIFNFLLNLCAAHKTLGIAAVMCGIASPLTLMSWIVYMSTAEQYNQNARFSLGNSHRLAITSSVLSFADTILISISVRFQTKKVSPQSDANSTDSLQDLPSISRGIGRRGRRNNNRTRNSSLSGGNDNRTSHSLYDSDYLNRNLQRTQHNPVTSQYSVDGNDEVIIRAPPPYENQPPPPYEQNTSEPPPPYEY